jgi:hypothetical protein
VLPCPPTAGAATVLQKALAPAQRGRKDADTGPSRTTSQVAGPTDVEGDPA